MDDTIQKIKYTLKKYSRAKSIKLRVRSSGDIIVIAPKKMNETYINIFVQSNHEWIIQQQKHFSSLPPLNTTGNLAAYTQNKEKARNLIIDFLNKINIYYQYQYQGISIRNQKTRWGSCSNKKKLNFNYKIIFLPSDLIEYIVTHELCHLKEMNHGKKFWNLVEETIPDYRERHLRLKKYKL